MLVTSLKELLLPLLLLIVSLMVDPPGCPELQGAFNLHDLIHIPFSIRAWFGILPHLLSDV